MTQCKDLNITGMVQCKNFVITGVAMLTVTSITGTDTAPIGTATATFTATVTNSGTASGTATVTFYTDTTILATPSTGTIAPGGTQGITVTINPSTWSVGTYGICAKTNYEP